MKHFYHWPLTDVCVNHHCQRSQYFNTIPNFWNLFHCDSENTLDTIYVIIGPGSKWVRRSADKNLTTYALQWRHDEHDCVSNHQPCDCFLNRLFRCRSKRTSKLRVTGLCAGNSPVTGEFPAQMTSNAEKAFIWWRLHMINAHAPNCPDALQTTLTFMDFSPRF